MQLSQERIFTKPKRKRDAGASKSKKLRLTKAMVARVKKGDLRFVDTQFGDILDTTVAVNLLNGLIPGTGETNRIGRKVDMKSLEIKIYITQNAGAALGAVTPSFFRMLLVYDKQPNAANPTWADVITSTDNAGAVLSTSRDFKNMSNSSRFRILRDWRSAAIQTTVALGAGGAQSAYQVWPWHDKKGGIRVIEDFVNLTGMGTSFNLGTAGTIADITTGSLLLMALGSVAAANAEFSANVFSRLRFYD